MTRLSDIKKAKERAKLTIEKDLKLKQNKLNNIRNKIKLLISLFLKKGVFFSIKEMCECGSVDSIFVDEKEYCIECMKER